MVLINFQIHSNKGLETPKLLSVQKRVDWFLFTIMRNDKKNIGKVSKFLNLTITINITSTQSYTLCLNLTARAVFRSAKLSAGVLNLFVKTKPGKENCYFLQSCKIVLEIEKLV